MIVFTKDLSATKLKYVYNNQVIIFNDDDTVLANKYCDIVHSDFTARIYADPVDGNFRFNFKDYLIPLAVRNNLSDVVVPLIDSTLPSLVYPDNENSFFNLLVDIVVTKEDDTTVTLAKTYGFIIGAEQVDDYQRRLILNNNFALLQQPLSINNYQLNYWAGYPFDLSIFSEAINSISVTNITTSASLSITPTEEATRFVFSDAYEDYTIEDHLTLVEGYNSIDFVNAGNSFNINLIKHSEQCGVYIKFRNPFGGWSYWLFKDIEETIKPNASKDIFNDHDNIEDTISPTLQSEPSKSNAELLVFAQNVSSQDLQVLRHIVESTKIYLFTGEPYSANSSNTDNQWLEIKCLTRTITKSRYNRKRFNIPFTFQLPNRNLVNLV